MCYIITIFLTKSLLHEDSSIYKNMLYQKPKAYAVPFLQRGCCAHPQVVNYECGKHIAPHTYTNAIAYAVLFFQRGYSAHPQILNYEGRKHTATPTYTSATTCAAHFLLHILVGRLLCTPTNSELRR